MSEALPVFTREEAILLFGNLAKTAENLRISRQAIYQWPDDNLPQKTRDKIIAALVRKRMPIPKVLRA